MTQNTSNPVSGILTAESELVGAISAITAMVDRIGTGKVAAAREALSLACAMAANRLKASADFVTGTVGALVADCEAITESLAGALLANMVPAPMATPIPVASLVDTIPVAHPVQSTDPAAFTWQTFPLPSEDSASSARMTVDEFGRGEALLPLPGSADSASEPQERIPYGWERIDADSEPAGAWIPCDADFRASEMCWEGAPVHPSEGAAADDVDLTSPGESAADPFAVNYPPCPVPASNGKAKSKRQPAGKTTCRAGKGK